jgi:hypothetical protein
MRIQKGEKQPRKRKKVKSEDQKKLYPDPHSYKMLDPDPYPDPHVTTADPKH